LVAGAAPLVALFGSGGVPVPALLHFLLYVGVGHGFVVVELWDLDDVGGVPGFLGDGFSD